MDRRREVLTTGQVARICNVAPRTVSKWFDSGQLRGYRIPGSKDRRIPVAYLIRFMRAHSMPLNGLDEGQTHVLVVDGDTDLLSVLRESLEADGAYSVSAATSAFEAGVIAGQHLPEIMVVDVTLPDLIPRQLVHALRANEDLRGVRLIGTSGGITEGQGQALMQDGFDNYLRKPFEIRQLIQAIEELVAVVS
ncbi:MAG TPA: response regulator [Phycisphaerae bacterium]|nr:response regulator [Phycisphaerae bacterium]